MSLLQLNYITGLGFWLFTAITVRSRYNTKAYLSISWPKLPALHCLRQIKLFEMRRPRRRTYGRSLKIKISFGGMNNGADQGDCKTKALWNFKRFWSQLLNALLGFSLNDENFRSLLKERKKLFTCKVSLHYSLSHAWFSSSKHCLVFLIPILRLI